MQSLAINQSEGVRVPDTARTLTESARREIGGVTRLYAPVEGLLPDVKGGWCKRQGRRLTAIETTSHYSSYVNYEIPLPISIQSSPGHFSKVMQQSEDLLKHSFAPS